MMSWLSRILSILTLCISSHALAKPDEGLSLLRDYDRRVAAISYRLATSNVALCPDVENWSGMTVHDLNQYGPRFREAARETFGLRDDNQPAILAIIEDSPAARAGLREDDAVLAINGAPVVAPPLEPQASYRSIDRINSLLEAALATGRITVTVANGQSARTVELAGTPGCTSRVEVGSGTDLNAAADGQIVQVSAALIEFVDNDDELAVMTAHEMAHNILRHREKLKAAHVPRGLLSFVGRNAARIKTTEEEADYLGLYLAARAGYDISAGIKLWERLGRNTLWGIFGSPTHPGWKVRQAVVRATMAEIDMKKAGGLPLAPSSQRPQP